MLYLVMYDKGDPLQAMSKQERRPQDVELRSSSCESHDAGMT
jgi:hypothetical protein